MKTDENGNAKIIKITENRQKYSFAQTNLL